MRYIDREYHGAGGRGGELFSAKMTKLMSPYGIGLLDGGRQRKNGHPKQVSGVRGPAHSHSIVAGGLLEMS